MNSYETYLLQKATDVFI